MPGVTIEILTGDPFSWSVRADRSAVAIGVFDGVHLGHQAVLSKLTDRAAGIGGVSIALTFDPHPLEFIAPDRAPRLLTSIAQRASVMEECGVSVIGVLPFPQIRDLEPRLFATEIIAGRLNADWVAVGGNFRFGRNRSGDPELLAAVGRELGFDVDVVSMVGEPGQGDVSSTRIRDLLGDGDVRSAAELLGRRFALAGPVVHGDARGRSIGFSTANIHVPERFMVPADGVYAVRVGLGERVLDGVVNIGVRPTFGMTTRTVEAHIVDFDEDIYGEELTIEFVDRLRGERSFDSVEALVEQIAMDTERAVEVLEVERGA